jgi:hypothetical protein
MDALLAGCRNRNQRVPERPVWLSKARAAVLGTVVRHLPLIMLSVLALALGMVAPFALYAGQARAETPRLVPAGQSESEGALGVAVDQSTSESDASRGDVYVAGFATFEEQKFELGTGRVNKFDPSGSLLSPPSPFGVAPSFGEKGSAYSGAAVNPVNGDVYALDALGSEIDTYDPATGAPLGSFPVEGSGNFFFLGLVHTTVVAIATDTEGNVYVPVVPKGEVLEYNPSECLALPEPCALTPLKTFTGGATLHGPTGVSVDPAGDVWVADAGNERIVELSPADTVMRQIASEGVHSVAVDAQGDVFATVSNSVASCGKLKPPCPHLVEYDPAGTQVANLGGGVIGAEAAQETNPDHLPDMVAVSSATGRVYVTEGVAEPREHLRSRVFTFRKPVAPTLESEVAVEVGVSGATLGAVVNPGGISAAYRFEYGTTNSYGKSVPFPEGDTGGGFTSRSVWAHLSGLQPDTTYHYRVVVSGALGEPLEGKDQTFITNTAAQSACPNEQFRTGFSANLPDCRAYELVTPPNKASAQPDKNKGGNGGELNVEETLENNSAAPDGGRLTFNSEDVRPGSLSAGRIYLTARGSGGWSADNLTPPTNYYGFQCTSESHIRTLSEDFSKAVIAIESGGPCGVEPELVGGEPRGVVNIFLRDNAAGSYQLVNLTPPGVTPANAAFVGGSADLSRVFFREPAKLTPDALEGVDNIYEWSAGKLRLASVLADGRAVAASSVRVSANGSRVFFTTGGALYARVNGAETVQLDSSEAGGTGGGGTFQIATPDGSNVLFTDDASAGLTGDTVAASATNLYRYDFAAPPGERLVDLTPVSDAGAPTPAAISRDGSKVLFTDDASAELTSDTVPGSATNIYRYEAGQLTDLTPVAHPELQQMIAVSEDGSSVYFKAAGVLTAVVNQHGETAQSGQPNLYLSRDGATTFIAANTAEGSQGRLRVSANGAFLVFESVRSLTGYDNQNAVEIYLYAAAANSLTCVSCDPSGAPPTAGGPSFQPGRGAFEESAKRAQRNLSENGRVFFDSSEALLPSDTNATGGCSSPSGVPACTDVYEFEPPGVGSCADPAGCLYLISTGTGSLETFFIDASPSGNDVFIREFQKLVPRDTQEGAPSLYDVRVGGGFPEHAPPPPCTTADACRTAPPPQPSIFGATASQMFSGAGNLAAPQPAVNPLAKPKPKPKKCRKGYVKKKGKCVKAKKARKARKTNRGGSR